MLWARQGAQRTAAACRGGVQRFQAVAAATCRSMATPPPAYQFHELYSTNHLGLPRLPIPDLDATLDRYLASLTAVTEPAELETHRKLVESFRVNEGPVLQQQLVAADAHAGYPNSYIEKYWDDMYLGLRCPLSVHVAPGYGLRPDADCGTDRAMLRLAKFISATFLWQQKSLAGHMEPDQALGCMSFLSRLLGTSRVPKKTRDELRFWPASTHIAVQCAGRIFRVDVLGKNGIVGVEALHRQLQYVYSKVPPPSQTDADPGVGILTREDRDVWAGVRASIEGLSAANRTSLEEVDSALFVVCLDHEEPASTTQRSQDLLHGRPGNLGNRWYDKMQVIWSPAGTISLCFEHTYSDGIVWNRWLTDVWHHMQGSPPTFAPLPTLPETPALTPPREIAFDTTPEVEGRMRTARANARALVADVATHKVECSTVGKASFKQWKLSPDAAVQMALQLAYYNLHGRVVPTYESCSTKNYFHGRTEVIRSAHQAGADFCRAVATRGTAVRPGYTPVSRQEQAGLLKAAVQRQIELSKLAVAGQGVDRHLHALQKVAVGILPTSDARQSADSGRLPGMFQDAPFAHASTWRLSTSNPSAAWNEVFNFGPVCADGYGVGYLVHENEVLLNVTAFKASGETDADLMARSIHESFATMRDLMDV